MKLVRFGDKGSERAGIIDEDGTVRDVSKIVSDWTSETLNHENLSRLRGASVNDFDEAPANVRLGPPIKKPGKIVGCALTYGKHAAEAGLETPKEVMFLLSSPTALNGPHDDVVMPRGATELDWEVELGMVFAKGGKYIPVEDALDHVAGFCVGNDVSERIFQLERGTQWTKGKSADTLKPLGPWLVTCDEVGDPNQLDISLTLNGKTMQSSNTSDMVFSIAEIISKVSEYLSFEPGDVLITGTPEGVGYGMKPQLYLKPGDVMEAKIEKLGAQRNIICEYDG